MTTMDVPWDYFVFRMKAYKIIHNFTEEKGDVAWGRSPPIIFERQILPPTNYISLEREFKSEYDSF